MNKKTISKNKIAFWFGTEAEILKSFLVILKMREQGYSPIIISTGQNDLNKSNIVVDYNLEPDLVINKFINKKLPLNLVFWFFSTIFFHFFKIRNYIKKNNIEYVVVHGDTVSTLMGAIIGMACGVSVIHLEAGLRSHNLTNPFPEEIDRIIVSKIAKIHFCQDSTAVLNLRNTTGEIINTHGNVVCDTVDLLSGAKSKILNLLSNEYALVTFHRAEQLLVKEKLEMLVGTTIKIAEKIQVLFVLFEFTEQILKKNGLLNLIINHPNIMVTPRVQYAEFITLMCNATLVMTDGGSNQEELAHLGIPTLIMRTHTERIDGLDNNIILSKFNNSIINKFLDNYSELIRERKIISKTPAQIVADHLLCLN